MTIPDALVEKAARALAACIGRRHGQSDDNWLSEARLEEARAVLTAIAPDLLALGRAQGIEEAAAACEAYLTPARRAQLIDGIGSLLSPEKAYYLAGKSHAAAIRSLPPPGEAKP